MSSYETPRDQLGTSHPHTHEALTTLADYYDATGRAEQAEEFRVLISAPVDGGSAGDPPAVESEPRP